MASNENCPNYELCGHTRVPEIGSDFCGTCGSWFKHGGFGWNQLTFIDSSDTCVICYGDDERKLIFPAGCGHSFCIKCSKELLFFDAHRYCKSPVFYGCPPCPNGCENPEKGYQCNCLEYDPVVDQWMQNDFDNWNRWNDDQNESIDNGDPISAFSKATCPLCRAEYKRQ